jgi:hypothetical protein
MMRMRSMAWAVWLVAATFSAGCDTCVDCLCHCTSGETIRLQYYTGFDCGQRCENGPGGCGVGKVRSVECLVTEIVDGRPDTVRCAQADPVGPQADSAGWPHR